MFITAVPYSVSLKSHDKLHIIEKHIMEQMFKVFAFGFETLSKTISSLIYRLINEDLLVLTIF